MTGSDSPQAMRAWSYGCPHSADPGGDAAGQLLLASRLWNTLIEITRTHEAVKDAIWRTDPATAAAMDTLSGARAAAGEIRAEMRQARITSRSTVPGEADKTRLEQAKTATAAARSQLDDARNAAAPGMKDAFASALRDRTAQVKATYASYVQAGGLGWGTWNDIVRRRFPAALANVTGRRAAGLPAELHFRRFDGTGTLTVQVMSQAGAPPRTLPALNSGTHPRSGVFRLSPWQDPAGAGRPRGQQQHGVMSLTIGRSRAHGPLHLELPVVLHRWIPAGADVTEVKVSRERAGSQYRWKVSVVAREDAPASASDGATVAVRLHWDTAAGGKPLPLCPHCGARQNGRRAHCSDDRCRKALPVEAMRTLRVAEVWSTGPLPGLPVSLHGVVRVTGASSAEVLYPAGWAWLLGRDADIREIRDKNLDVLRDQVTAALRSDDRLAEVTGVTAADVSRWRAPRRFAALAAVWPEGHSLVPVLAAWRKRDRHLWDYEQHESAQVLGRRRDAWRCAAAWLCGGAESVTVHGLDVAELKRIPDVSEEDPEMPARQGRWQSHSAAPGEFRAAVVAAAKARGIDVILW